MGDSFTDPSKQAPVPFVLNPVEDETESEPEGEETVEDEPPVVVEPEQDPLPAGDLVTVTGPDGEAVDLELIVANGAEAETPSDADYVVTAPEGVNRIEVGYDDHTTFRIDYNVGTKSVDAGLNSEINGNDGVNSRTITWEPDENGANVRTLSWVKEFESSTNVIMHVAEDDIGRHVAQIELLNPGDVLKFDFENDVTGNLHLVYDETEEGTEGDTNTTKRAFLIRTDADVTSLSTDQIAALVNDADGQNASGQVLAEIYLGEETLLIKGDPTSGEDYEVRMTNYINDKPVITSTIAFTSVTETQDLLVGEEPAAAEAEDGRTEPSGDESTEGGFGDLLEGAGINPAFFGF
ncbi:hypothetical protein AB2B41_08665 [Marimonas sp. MJW-29]|uniref:DUF5801 domain-containing protein n=1 Tax=Sulfitobacter sediminis TaxID=3234186 RepID=A0ABV3RL09_9RHOB